MDTSRFLARREIPVMPRRYRTNGELSELVLVEIPQHSTSPERLDQPLGKSYGSG